MRRLLWIFLFLTISLATLAQKPKHVFYGFSEQLDEKNISGWIANKPTSYSGVYHFSESEAEWDLIVIVIDSSIFLQLFNNEWANTDEYKEGTWVRGCRTFKNCRLTKNKFTSDSLNGYFVNYKEDTIARGIILTSPTGTLDTVEFGFRGPLQFSEYFGGKYPEMSFKILDDSFFSTKTKDHLQLMRNEVFARYGMRFAKNGKMHNHFSKTRGYIPWRNNVEACLTEIEKRNIEKLLSFEKNSNN